jgi:hypothetical protein
MIVTCRAYVSPKYNKQEAAIFNIDTSTAASSQPAFQAQGTPGWFTAGNVALSVPPTTISCDWLNSVQDELGYVVTQNGGTLVKANTTQVYNAIAAQIATAIAVKGNLSGGNTWTGGTNYFSQVEVTGNLNVDGNAYFAAATADTPATNDNSLNLATTAYVQNQGYTPLTDFVSYGTGTNNCAFSVPMSGSVGNLKLVVFNSACNAPTSAGTPAETTVAIPYPFPTACIGAICQFDGSNPPQNATSVSCQPYSSSGVQVYINSSTSYAGGSIFGVVIWAIGY